MDSPSKSRLAQARFERRRSIKFTDPFNPVPRVPAPVLVRRGKTASSIDLGPRSPARPTVEVRDHQIVGRAPPVARFKMVTSPRSPITRTTTFVQRKGARVPLRSRSTTVAHSAQVNMPASYGVPLPPHATSTISRKSGSGLPHSHQAVSSRSYKRGALPRAWGSTSRDAATGSNRRDTLQPQSLEPFVDMEHRRRASDSAIITKPAFAEYPHLSAGDQGVLMTKLSMLLNSVDIDSQQLSQWQRSSAFERAVVESSARHVFGVAIKESVSYSSCKVVLGEYTHYLPTCVFASVEEICSRGITTPALFRIAPSQNKRTLEHLTSIYNTGPAYGQTHSLANENISNVCALLKLYLRGLPEPVFSTTLWSPLRQVASGQAEPRTRTAAVQAMLHLLDRSSFSTLVYVLAFLYQLALHGDENGLTISTIAEMFGPALFAPRTKATAVSVGVVLNPKPEVPALVKTFRSSEDKFNAIRVLAWILERWEHSEGGIAAGLLSLDIARDGEDIAEWAARFAVEQRRDSFGSDLEAVFDEDPAGDRNTGREGQEQSTSFPFPEVVTVEQVRVKKVKHSTVEIMEAPLPQSTHPSSPATIWSQETVISQKNPNVHAGSAPISFEDEPSYVTELRQRMQAQESELVSLRRELASIRDRFVFPMPSTRIVGNLEATDVEVSVDTLDGKISAEEEMDEDMMPTPRPPSGPRFGDPPTPTSTSAMRELVDSLQSEPITPLFGRALRIKPALSRKNSDEILGENVFADLGYSTSPSDSDSEGSHVSDRAFYVVNPDPSDEGSKEKGELSELYAARDALKGALAAMEPVQIQLKAVEQELQSRAG
ncbi:hypothetical protein RhiJN_23625 [Ceratobasidium sp. AG-Ba]|nr:hypothetical protein RhiJN_23625 [Ceratobasidium sp. AG-Ba]